MQKGEVTTAGDVNGTQARGDTAMTNTMWRCVQLRAGQILNKVLFNTRGEAESFVAQMQRAEPDIFWRMEPVEARLVWN